MAAVTPKQFEIIVELLTLVLKGLDKMSDAQTKALADLSTAVAAMGAAVTAATAEISSLIANMQPDDSAAIEAQVTAINTATAALTAALPTPPAPAPTT